MNAIQFFADKNCSETVDPLDIGYRPVGAELFQLEMFLVDIGNEKDAWCGSLQNLSDGEKHYFKGWSELVANLQNILTPFYIQQNIFSGLARMSNQCGAFGVRSRRRKPGRAAMTH